MVRLHRAGWVLASGLLLTGCDVVSGIWWTLAIVFGLVGLFVTWVSFVDGEPGVGFFGLLVLLFAFWLSPVLVSEVPWIGPPTAAKLGLPSASEAQPKRTSRIVQAAVPAQPKAQLLETKKQLVAIREKAEKLGPMRDRYQAELSDYERTLRKKLPATGVASHEELLRRRDEHLETALLLERAAELAYYIRWLTDQLQEYDTQRLELDQAVWKLEKIIEMSEVADQEQLAELRRTILRTQELVDKQVPTPQKQDVAELEAQLFQRLR